LHRTTPSRWVAGNGLCIIVGDGQWIVHNCNVGDSQPTRNQVFQQAKSDAGVAGTQSPSRQGWINTYSKGEPARIYEFDTPKGKRDH